MWLYGHIIFPQTNYKSGKQEDFRHIDYIMVKKKELRKKNKQF